jgi:hypothetical protein
MAQVHCSVVQCSVCVCACNSSSSSTSSGLRLCMQLTIVYQLLLRSSCSASVARCRSQSSQQFATGVLLRRFGSSSSENTETAQELSERSRVKQLLIAAKQ